MTYDTSSAQLEWTIYRVGQGILLDGQGHVLLSGNRWFSDKPLVWTLPGGRTDEGEGIAEAVVREFKEETGLDIEVGGLAYVAESRSAVQRKIYLVCAFEVRQTGGNLGCEADEGVEELRWVGVDELAAYLPSSSLGDPLRGYLSAPGNEVKYWFFPEYTA